MMKTPLRMRAALLAVLFVGMSVPFAAAQTYTLFSNGATSYTIVVSPKAPEAELNAANELQSCLAKIGNVNIAISNKVQSAGRHIYIGYDTALKYHGGSAAKLEDEAYAYLSKNANIYIYGKTARATMYGVFAFLEDELGVRWFASDVTRLPKRGSYAFSRLNVTSSPGMAIRTIGYKEAEDALWCAHNKVNGGGVPERYGGSENYWGSHTSGQYVPESKYFASHPEYFAMRNGKRVSGGQLCLSNSDVLKIVVNEILARIAASPENIIYDLSQNDNQYYCTCAKCTALAEKYQAQSGVWLWFVNQVARQIKKKYPGKYIGTFAYLYTRKPPVGIVPDDNVVIRLCSIECCFTHSLEGCSEECNRNFIADMKEWSKIAKHLYIWDYVVTYTQYLGPFPNFNVLGPNIQPFAKYNAMGVYEEAQYQTLHGEFSELRSYVLARLLWNPRLSASELAADFIKGYYGSAADYAQQYYNLVMGLVGGSTHCGIYPDAQNALFTDAFVTKALSLLTEAKKHCSGNDELQRIERLWLSPAYLSLMRGKSKKGGAVYKEFVRIAQRDGIRIGEGITLEQMIEKLKK